MPDLPLTERLGEFPKVRVVPAGSTYDEVFSLDEVARAARVPESRVRALVEAGHASAVGGFLATPDAVRLVRMLRSPDEAPAERRPLFTGVPHRGRRTGTSLVVSGLLHAAGLALLLTLASLGLFNAADTEQTVPAPAAHLVFLISLGPGGGGGGGGLQMPAPPPPAERKAPKPEKKISNPVPPVKKTPAPPRVIERPPLPAETPRPTPPPILPPTPPRFMPPPQAIQAPVVPVPADPVDSPGTLTSSATSAIASNGPGTGGGIGTGSGAGIGEGRGGGIGPGSDGGTGGGPFQPGSGVAPPVLLREVRPSYTDEARRRAIEGDVELEIVVRQDGSVGNVKVTRTLGAGLEQKAVDAVRQWRFEPARRQGAPVEVVVDVSVEFKLR